MLRSSVILVICLLKLDSAEKHDIVGSTETGLCSIKPGSSGGKLLCCDGVSFGEFLAKMAENGEDLIGATVEYCTNRQSRQHLNATCFEKNTNLTSLRISACRVGTVATGTFRGLSNLNELHLTQNFISVIPNGTFDGLQHLSKLDLSENNIGFIEDGTFSGLKNLTVLNLAGNEKLQLSYNLLSGLTSLTRLSLKNTNIKTISYQNTDEDLPVFFEDQINSLTDLNLQDTNFTNDYLTILSPLKKLRQLDFSFNYLGYMQKGLLPTFVGNATLDLSNNILVIIKPEAFSVTPGGHLAIFLSRNSLMCDCSMVEFARFLRKKKEHIIIRDGGQIRCAGPISKYDTLVIKHEAPWWECSPSIPLVALLAVVGLAILITLIAVIVACNFVNLRHCLLERRMAYEAEYDKDQDSNEGNPLFSLGHRRKYSRLRQTGAFILYNMDEPEVLKWVNHHIEEKLHLHPVRLSLQWSAGPGFKPLWKQVKEYGFDVRHFLVVVTRDLLQNHWPEMSEKSGLENLSKFVLVLMGVKKRDLPKDLARLGCPCFEWPDERKLWTSLRRERVQFWKRLRLALKDQSD